MAFSPYTSVSITLYNDSPPTDDGSTAAANQLTWAKHKTKLGDPLKTAIESINTNIISAFGKNIFNSKVAIGGDTTLSSTAHGKLHTVSGTTTTTLPAAGTVEEGFVTIIQNVDAALTTTIAANGSETINSASTLTLTGQYEFAICMSDGTNFVAVSNINLGNVAFTQRVDFSGDLTPTQITANQNNYDPTSLATALTLRINSDAARSITGLAGGVDGRLIHITNTGSFEITLEDENASSTASNRFALNGDIVLRTDGSIVLWYDSTSSRWRTFGASVTKNATFNTVDVSDGTTQVNAATVPDPQGYLTLVTGTPVATSDQASKTTAYYTPDAGGYVPISDGSGWTAVPFTELSMGLDGTGHVLDNIYDFYIWNDGGTLRLVTGVAWTTATAGSGARGSGGGTAEISRLLGRYTNTNSMTVRYGATTDTMGALEGCYVGSILMDGTNGQVTQHLSFGQSRKWGIWNAYNRRPIIMKAGDATASWAYSTATVRASNNDSTNKIAVFCGLADELIDIEFAQRVTNFNSGDVRIGIGWNSTTTESGKTGGVGSGDSTASSAFSPTAKYIQAPALGLNNVQSLEFGAANATFFGGNDDMQLVVRYRG